MEAPKGEQRRVIQRSAIAVDGAPISYVITLASVVGALAFIPLSVAVGLGKPFPMSQGVYPLVGLLLGPYAGALANGVGALVGVLIFPHTSNFPFATVAGAMVGGLAGGAIADHQKRRWLAWIVAGVGWIAYLAYMAWAVVNNGVALPVFLLATLINSSALLLYTLPTRGLVSRWLKQDDLKLVAAGLFLSSWMCAGLTHLIAGMTIYFRVSWPESIFVAMTPLAPIENAVRALIGSVIGSGVIAGLRATGLIKPDHAAY